MLKTGPNPDLVSETIGRLDKLLYHRGPDSGGAYLKPDRGFLNRRLAIVDQKGGDQPIYSENRMAGIVYNGEVYNFPELRERCEEKGVRFATHTDTEAVLQTFLQKREDGFRDLEGMYGLCVWDEATDEVFLARDPFGMKPMYIYEDAKKIIFSSELSAIVGLPDIDLTPDPHGVGDYLVFRYIPANRTIYKNIRRMSPGTHVKISRAGVGQEYSFFDLASLRPELVHTSFEETKDELRRLLLTSVQQHLVGEAPIALLLSGGVDSSILAAVLNELGVPMEGFNIGFPNLNEFEYATDVANRHNIKLHNVEIEPNILARDCEKVISQLDEPLADPAQFPLYFLSEHIRRYATVVLSGEGADELFGGYPQYQTHVAKQNWSEALPSFLNSSYYFLENEAYIDRPNGLGWHKTRRYMTGRTALVSQSTYDFKTWVPDNLMMKADKIAMRHSLEGRFPFLTRQMLSFAHSLPDTWKISEEGETKLILKKAFEDVLPGSVLTRRKMGFSVPTGEILHQMKDYVRDSFSELRKTEFAECLDVDSISSTFDAFLDGQENLALRCWTLFVFAAWVSGRHAGVAASTSNAQQILQEA